MPHNMIDKKLIVYKSEFTLYSFCLIQVLNHLRDVEYKDVTQSGSTTTLTLKDHGTLRPPQTQQQQEVWKNFP